MKDRAPYPGLRPFSRDETDLFFGREGNVEEIVDRFANTRFVAVLGASGSGKSSLVRTGLLDALELGLLRDAGSEWRIADFRPGGGPLRNLAMALLASEGADGKKASPDEIELLSTYLGDGPRSLLQWCRNGHLEKGTNLLLLVDQFEELFRYDSYETQEQAQAFVNLLIESSTRQTDVPIYVVLTMRSEYLGACAQIAGLAEAINRGQYLTPRMTREQCRMAIVGPAEVCDVDIKSDLVDRLLNDLAIFAPFDESGPGAFDAGTSQLDRLARRADQLPLMQHVLNRLWARSRSRGDSPITLRLEDYDDPAIGGLANALSVHAEEILTELQKDQEKQGKDAAKTLEVVQTVFRALTLGTSTADAVRRPTTVGDLIDLAGGDQEGVRATIEAYRGADRHFLLPAAPQALLPTVTIDISHESLIRQWKRLHDWVEVEAQAASWWRRLVEAANRHASNNGDWLRGRDLALSLQGRREYKPSLAWAQRYGGDYNVTLGFLDGSRAAKTRSIVAYVAVVAVAVGIIGGLGYYSWYMNVEQGRMEANQRRNALEAMDGAVSAVETSQDAGGWTEAGRQLAALLRPFVNVATGETDLPSLDPKFDQVLHRQHLSYGAGQHVPVLPLDGLNPPRALVSQLGTAGKGKAAIAVADARRATVARMNDSLEWQPATVVEFAGALKVGAARTTNPSAIALFDSGRGLALAFRDRLLIARLKDDGSAVWQTREIVAELPRRSDADVKLAACNKDGSRLILKSDNRFYWIDAAVPDGTWLATGSSVPADDAAPPVKWQPIFGGRSLSSWSVDPEFGALAAVTDNGRVVWAKCGSLDTGATITTPFDGTIRDIEFSAGSELGLVSRDLRVTYVRFAEDGKVSPPAKVGALPSDVGYAGFATGHQLWALSGKSLYQLWDNDRQQFVAAVSIKDGAPRNLNLGGMPLLFSGEGKSLVAHRPLADADADRTAMALAVLLRVERDEYYRKAEANARFTHKLLADAKLLPAQGSVLPPALQCDAVLAALVASADLNSAQVESTRRKMLEEAKRVRDRCHTGSLLTSSQQLRDLLIDGAPRGVTEDDHFRNVIHSAVAAGAAGDPHALRLLSRLVAGYEVESGAFDDLSISFGGPLSHPVLPTFGENRIQQLTPLKGRQRSAALQRLNSPFGADHEQLAILYLLDDKKTDAAYHAAIALRLHESVQDDEGMQRASRLLGIVLGTESDANRLAEIWKKAWTFRPAAIVRNMPAAAVQPPSSIAPGEQMIVYFRSIANRVEAPAQRAALLRLATIVAKALEEMTDEIAEQIYDDIVRVSNAQISPDDMMGGAAQKAEIANILYSMTEYLPSARNQDRRRDAAIRSIELFDASSASSYQHVQWLRDSIKDITAFYPTAPDQVRGRVRKLRLRFLLPDEADLSDRRTERRSLLDSSAALLDLMAKDGPVSPALLAAQAGHRLWMASLVSSRTMSADSERDYLNAAVELFSKAQMSGANDVAVRLSQVEAIRRLAARSEGKTEAERLRTRVTLLTGAATVLRGVLGETDGLFGSKRGIAVTALSDIDADIAMDAASIVLLDLETGDRKAALVTAWLGIRAAYEEEDLLRRYGNLPGVSERRNRGVSTYALDRVDASIVGILAGPLSKTPGQARNCAAVADQPWDPKRTTFGVPYAVLAENESSLRAALAICEAEYGKSPNAKLASLIARLYSFDPEKAQQTVEKFVEAIVGGETYALRGLANVLKEERCSLSEPLMDRYRYLTLNGHWKVVEPLLRREIGNPEPSIIEWMAYNAQKEPALPADLPRWADFDLAYVKKACPSLLR